LAGEKVGARSKLISLKTAVFLCVGIQIS